MRQVNVGLGIQMNLLMTQIQDEDRVYPELLWRELESQHTIRDFSLCTRRLRRV